MTSSSSYDLVGILLESCSCRAPCPCWIGDDPDDGYCEAVNAYRIDRGRIGDVDVSDCSYVRIVTIPGNVFDLDSWNQLFLIDSRLTDEQARAIVDAYHGVFGGPLADVASLVRTTLGIERARIAIDVDRGRGTVRVDGLVDAELEPYRGADGTRTTLWETRLTTEPTAPAYVASAVRNAVRLDKYGVAWSFEGRSAMHSVYRVKTP